MLGVDNFAHQNQEYGGAYQNNNFGPHPANPFPNMAGHPGMERNGPIYAFPPGQFTPMGFYGDGSHTPDGSQTSPPSGYMGPGCMMPSMDHMGRHHMPDSSSLQPEFDGGRVSPPITPPPTRERFSYTRYQLELLNAIYEKIKYPNSIQKQLAAKRVGITRDQTKIWFQNRRRKDVVAAGNNKKRDDLKQERIMVPDHVVKSIVTELMKYEDDPKGKKLKARLSAHSTGQNRHSPYNATNRRQMYKEESIPNAIVPGYNQVTSFENIQKRLKQEMYQQGPSSSSSSASSISTTALEMSPPPGMTQLDMIAPPNAVAPSIDLSTGDASTGDLSSPGPLPEIIQNQHFGEQHMQMIPIPHPDDSSSSGTPSFPHSPQSPHMDVISQEHQLSPQDQAYQMPPEGMSDNQIPQFPAYGMIAAYPFMPPMGPDGKAPYQESYPHGMMPLYRPPYMGMSMPVGSYYPMDTWQQPGQPDQQPMIQPQTTTSAVATDLEAL